MYTRFANARTAASSVADFLQGDRLQFSQRPWNRHKPDETLWWLVPSTVWPAYHLGKFIFIPRGEYLLCGLNVEKGLGPATQGFYGSKVVMDGSWKWHGFLRDIENGKVEQVLSDIELPKYLLIGGSISGSGDFDPNAPKPDNILFRFADDGLVVEENQLGLGELAPLADLQELRDLPAALKKIPSLDWLWLDLVAGVRLRRPVEGADLSDALDGWDLVNKVFSPLLPWLGTE